MSKLVRTVVVDILEDQPISRGAIAEARYMFKRETADEPDTLVLSHESYYTLLREMPPQYIDFHNHKYMGLELRQDADFEENEWRVRKSDSKTYAVKGSES